mmetsp:Transcript_13588/g.32179  ORF Transcript_13588/g.32179 Transcript_13588/m.32179 type:complete len:237 (+) Transcript_13588:381-1091(+)
MGVDDIWQATLNAGMLATCSFACAVFVFLQAAKSHGVWIVGGSIPEVDETSGAVYNTCIVVAPDGAIVTAHRKMHLFDIDIPGKFSFRESDTLTGGSQITVFDSPFGKIGVGICYDLRFPELSLLMRNEGARILVFPGAFNLVTGPAHWELLQRARALDTQSFVLTCSPARSEDDQGYKAWGHSTMVDPWGEVVATTEHGPAIVHATLEFTRVEEVRSGVPVAKQRRNDLYKLEKV